MTAIVTLKKFSHVKCAVPILEWHCVLDAVPALNQALQKICELHGNSFFYAKNRFQLGEKNVLAEFHAMV